MSDPADTALARSVVRAPHPRLRDLVSSYHGYRYRVDGPSVHHGLPATSLTMVIAFDQPIDVGWLGDPRSRRQHWALASGMSVEPAGIYGDGTQHGIQLDLTPAGARALLGVPAADLRRAIVPLDDVLGSLGRRLYDNLLAARGWSARFAVLDRELAMLAAHNAEADAASNPGPTLDRAWQRIHQTGGTLSVSRLAHEVGWSRRQLSARFGGEFGIGPKQTARLVRFAAARELVLGSGLPLADVAARSGYADQAHLTREWRELAGVPPTTWLRVERPFLQDQAADA